MTVTAAVALAAPEVAVMVAVPFPIAVTNPAAETVAIEALDELHVMVAPAITVPPASRTVAVTVAVSPGAAKTSESGDSVIETATCWMEAEAFSDAEPEVAVMVAEPSATAVTNPVEDTVATDALDELQVTLAPLIVAPFWSLTVAESCCVAPKDEKLRLVADRVIEVATGVGGLVGVVPPSPHARSKSTAVSRM